MYYINYHTGAGDEVTETLNDAMKIADDGACYTQQNITIEDDKENIVAQRTWYGVQANIEYDEDIIDFGSFGYYGPWELF